MSSGQRFADATARRETPGTVNPTATPAPLPEGGLGQIEILGHPANAPATLPDQLDRVSLERRREDPSLPLCHGHLQAQYRAIGDVHESGGASDLDWGGVSDGF